LESFSLTGDDALPEIADVIIKFSLFFLGFNNESLKSIFEKNAFVCHTKNIRIKKRERNKRKKRPISLS